MRGGFTGQSGGRARPRRSSRLAALVALMAFVGAGAVARAACPEPHRAAQRPVESACHGLDVSGVARSYRLYVPSASSTAMPVVFVLHGGGGNAANMEWLTRRAFNRLADRVGALIVYPEGIGEGWNDGREDGVTRSAREHVADVEFIRAVAAELGAQHRIDPRRIFATGISNGAMMSLRLACEAADLFSGVVAVAGNLPASLGGRCQPSRAIRLALINGTDDPLVPWNGGGVGFAGHRGQVWSAERSFALFAERFHCRDRGADARVDRVPDDATAYVLEWARGCEATAEVRLYRIEHGGHTWPGGARYAPQFLVGRVSRELDATAIIAAFLLSVDFSYTGAP